MKRRLLILLTTLVVSPVYGFAHEGHVHEPAVEAPKHGGLLRDAPPFKSEVVISGDQAFVYVYDGKTKDKDGGLLPVKLDKTTLEGDYQFPRDKAAKKVKFEKKAGLDCVAGEKNEGLKEQKKNLECYSAKLPQYPSANAHRVAETHRGSDPSR